MKLYSIADVAEIADLSPATIRRYIQSGKIKALRIGGTGHYRISREEVSRFLGIDIESKNTISFDESKRRLFDAIKNGTLKKFGRSA